MATATKRSSAPKKETPPEAKKAPAAAAKPEAAKPAEAKKAAQAQAPQTQAQTPMRIALSAAIEKKIAAVAKDLFPENEALRAATVVYGRKLLKFDSGKRSSKPPVPPALQGDKETTRQRLVTIAKALDVDPAKIGLGSEEAAK